MRCVICNKNLNDEESINKDSSGVFLDLCNNCNDDVLVDNDTLDEEEDNED